MNLSRSLALTMAGAPIPPSRTSSLSRPVSEYSRPNFSGVSIYKGVSERPLGWKPKRTPRNQVISGMKIRRWDGAARGSTEWDCLRKDPELWYPEGNCLIHLYGRGQSRRGPAFRVPMRAILEAQCYPLLDRFLANSNDSPLSDNSNCDNASYFDPADQRMFELYIPAPASIGREQAFLYHTATRNLFAWMCGKPLVGAHLGGALVGLLNSMNEFRSASEDHVETIMDYMDEEGYADMRNQPDHALAILSFAENFQFNDLWIDAFAHCAGMNDRLFMSPGFEHLTQTTRARITRSRLEMDTRLDHCGMRLSSFLSDDFSESFLGLSSGARAHLDKFRSFLQSYYVAKLGYYPPESSEAGRVAFPKSIYGQMCSEFQKLYDFLVDSNLSIKDSIPVARQGGICVYQSVQAFDQRYKYESLSHPYPLLPEIEKYSAPKSSLSKRLSLNFKADKMKPDARLVAFSSLTKATNRKNQSLIDCSLVRAYRGFEKECVFSPTKTDKAEKISFTEARKVRWLLIYSILQTLLSATRPPSQVRDTQNVQYSICVSSVGCPPWQEDRTIGTLLRTQTDQAKEDFQKAFGASTLSSGTETITPIEEIKPDVDYFSLIHRPQPAPAAAESFGSSLLSKRGTVRRALGNLGNMPELRHPRPQRASFHEILVRGYGNGTNKVNITISSDPEPDRKPSADSTASALLEDISSRWSNSDLDMETPRSSVSASSSRESDLTKLSTNEVLERPTSTFGCDRVPSPTYSDSIYEDISILQPEPLQVNKTSGDCVRVTTEVTINWEDGL